MNPATVDGRNPAPPRTMHVARRCLVVVPPAPPVLNIEWGSAPRESGASGNNPAPLDMPR